MERLRSLSEEDTMDTLSSSLSLLPNEGPLATTTTAANATTSSSLPRRSLARAPSSGNSTGSWNAEANATTPGDGAPPVDFISTGPAVKSLFRIPISEQSVCVAVHNLDGTLIIDEAVPEYEEGAEEANIGSQANQDAGQVTRHPKLPPSSQNLAVALSPAAQSDAATSLSYLSNAIQMESTTDATTSKETQTALNPSPVREYVDWKFQDMNLLVGSDALVVRPESQEGVAVRVEEVNYLQRLLERYQESLQKTQRKEPRLPGHQSYAQALSQPTSEKNNQGREENCQKDIDPGSSPLDLDSVQLQTCVVPTAGPLTEILRAHPPTATANAVHSSQNMDTSSPQCIVLDAYLDNLMANVPQLALCLQEKGLIQSVKLLDRDNIPSMMMHPNTLDTSIPVETIRRHPQDPNVPNQSNDNPPDLFSPQIMEMNASALLRFLQANCTRNNATYLLRTDVDAAGTGANNIQLYDISSISQQRQKKWIWWLATMSYRFALRLRQLESHDVLPMRQRAFRDRQRSLLQTTLDLLQDLQDMDGNAHESLVASVREHIADTYLGETSKEAGSRNQPEATGKEPETNQAPPLVLSASSSPPRNSETGSMPPVPMSPSKAPMQGAGTDGSQQQPWQERPLQQPYAHLTVDALNKAQDHLMHGIKTLWPILERHWERKKSPVAAPVAPNLRQRKRGRNRSLSHPSDESEGVGKNEPSPAMVLQLCGLNYKVVNVSLRLAEHHLRQYSSSSVMQALRQPARRLADSVSFLRYLEPRAATEWLPRLQMQYTWLWENCGHFARSFASDDLWRDRGHACGDDVLSVLRDVEAAFATTIAAPFRFASVLPNPLTAKTHDMVNLRSLSAVVTQKSSLGDDAEQPGVTAARNILSQQGQLLRDRRQVLVAACLSYNRAIVAFQDLARESDDAGAPHMPSTTPTSSRESGTILNLLRQRLGDAYNETGKVLLAALRALLMSKQREDHIAADTLLDSAQFWFLEGLDAFEACQDQRNIALIRCNICQCYKLRANSTFSSQATEGATHAEVCLEKAASHLQGAHELLGTREIDPTTWDMVSEELAATFLVLAVRRRQSLLGGGNAPVILQSLRLTPGKERSVVEPMERALEIYQQSGNLHQAAAVQYQLALTNSKIWTCQRDEVKTREKLSAAFQQYNQAFVYFSGHLRGNEPTFALLCLDIASLYAAVSGEECLAKALTRCLDTYDAFSQEAIDTARNSRVWLEKMDTLASSVDDRVFKLLRNLAKVEPERYKDIYREGLMAKMVRSVPENEGDNHSIPSNLLALYDVLVTLRKQMGMDVPS